MNQLSERALFFGAGLAFGILVGFLVSGSPGPPAPAAPPPAPAPETASAPLPEPRPVDPEALQTLLAAVEATPEDPAARVAVADLHLDALDFGQAVYWLQQARNLDPSDLDVRSRLAFAQLGAGDVAGAVTGFEAVLAEDPEHFESLARAGPRPSLRGAGPGRRHRALGARDRGAAGLARGGGAPGPDRFAPDSASVGRAVARRRWSELAGGG